VTAYKGIKDTELASLSRRKKMSPTKGRNFNNRICSNSKNIYTIQNLVKPFNIILDVILLLGQQGHSWTPSKE